MLSHCGDGFRKLTVKERAANFVEAPEGAIPIQETPLERPGTASKPPNCASPNQKAQFVRRDGVASIDASTR